jgi:hypothetical protein
MKSVNAVLIEAAVVGVCLIAIVKIVRTVTEKWSPSEMLILFTSGFVFHIICEYIGVNKWYAVEYCKLLE